MPLVYSPGKEHDDFTEWAKSQGVVINGIAPARLAGKGLGLIAARDIKADELLVSVPAKALITIDSEAVRKLKLPHRSTVHGRLAAYLTIKNEDSNRDHRLWQAVWPTAEDFETFLPFCWPAQLQEQLPPSAKSLFEAQQKKLAKDLKDLKSYLPPSSEHLYEYFWHIVDTRVFFWEYPNTPPNRLPKKRSQLVADDCLALSPFADYFNHTDVDGCAVTSDRKGFQLKSTISYKAGEEIFISYGSHSNDFLLAEYGFTMPNNKWDSITLDHLILPKLSEEQKETLKDDKFLGNYTVSVVDSKPSPCNRTLAALRIASLPIQRYTAFVSGFDENERDQVAIESALEKLYDEYAEQCTQAERALLNISGNEAEEAKAEVLLKRWREIRKIIGRP